MSRNADFPPVQNMYGTDSLDSPIIIDDGPGDTTIRPPTPERLKWYIAEHERLAKLGFNLDGTPLKPPATNEPK